MTAATSVLAELEQRAGASDQDREAWLAERAQGITATEVAGLATGKKKMADLIRVKLGWAEDPFKGNRYTRWGKDREPHIAEQVRLATGVEPESRVFHAADNRRFLASPDGVGVNFDGQVELAEDKTTNKDLSEGSPDFLASGHPEQMTWAMRVTGARVCWYAWETRLEDEQGEFYPGKLSMFPFDYDEALADRLERIAVVFLALLDEAREMGQEAWEAAEASAVVIDDELDTLGVIYLRFLDEESAGKKAKAQVWDELHVLLAAKGGNVSHVSPLARITYTAGGQVEESFESVDMEAAMAADHGLWTELQDVQAKAAALQAAWDEHCKKHMVTTTRVTHKRPNLRVTSPKTMKEKKA